MKFNLGDVVCVKNSFDCQVHFRPIYGRINTIHIEDSITWYKIDNERRTFTENELELLDEIELINYLEKERKQRHEFVDQAIDAELKEIRAYIKKENKDE